MLIGADFYWDLVEDHVVRGNGPTAMKSKLGFLLSGPVHVQPDDSRATEHILNVLATPLPADMLERFWSLESMGISKTSDDMDKTDYFKNYQKSSIEHKNGSYTAKLPWKRDHPELPSNYDVSEKRTVNLIRRLQNDPPLLKKYDEIISEQERRGFIEKVNSDTPPTGPVHYIPHRPVKKDSTTTPIRIVYDCSSRKSPNLPSLSDCLESTRPILNELTKLIVSDAHTRLLHLGVNSTVIQLRQKFWIPSIRQCVRSVLRTCVKCTRVIGRPYRAPDPPPLPNVRVEECPPFSVTGVDITGALYVKNAAGSEKKCYICLFTCATTRAVHLEVVPDSSTDSFLQAFRRFASRKSMPTVMISDNATTYIAAANHLKMLINSPVVHGELSKRGVEWRFIPARAPWYGGFWERLIGLTKTTLKKVLGRRFVSRRS